MKTKRKRPRRGHSLPAELEGAIADYLAHFKREPKRIQVPCWRFDELEIGDSIVYSQTFHGIPLRFSNKSDAIELS